MNSKSSKKALEKGICRVLTDIERYASMSFTVLYRCDRCKSVDESIPFRMGAKYCFVGEIQRKNTLRPLEEMMPMDPVRWYSFCRVGCSFLSTLLNRRKS